MPLKSRVASSPLSSCSATFSRFCGTGAGKECRWCVHKQKQPECGASALCARLLFLAKLLVGQQCCKTEPTPSHGTHLQVDQSQTAGARPGHLLVQTANQHQAGCTHLQVDLKQLAQAGALHLDHHLLPAVQRGTVHLVEGGGVGRVERRFEALQCAMREARVGAEAADRHSNRLCPHAGMHG